MGIVYGAELQKTVLFLGTWETGKNCLRDESIVYNSLLRATKERAIYMRVNKFHHCPLLATHICFVYCVITAVQNIRIASIFLITCNDQMD